jgi:hypothetical protein
MYPVERETHVLPIFCRHLGFSLLNEVRLVGQCCHALSYLASETRVKPAGIFHVSYRTGDKGASGFSVAILDFHVE